MRQKISRVNKLKMLLVICIVLLGYLAFCFFAAIKFLGPSRSVPTLPLGVNAIDVPTPYCQNPTWATPNLNKATIVFLCAYGYRSTRKDWAPLFENLPKMAPKNQVYGVIAPAMPGQDTSPIKWVGFGPKEAQVIISTAEYVKKENPNSKIILDGVSLGAASAWLACDKRPDLFAGVFAEAGFPTLKEGVRDYLGEALYFGLYPMVPIACALDGVSINEVRPIEGAIKWHGKPGLIVQDEHDQHFPLSFAQEFAKASGCKLWLVKGASHAQALATEPEEYLHHLLALARQVQGE